jgi:hypothetical protein
MNESKNQSFGHHYGFSRLGMQPASVQRDRSHAGFLMHFFFLMKEKHFSTFIRFDFDGWGRAMPNGTLVTFHTRGRSVYGPTWC